MNISNREVAKKTLIGSLTLLFIVLLLYFARFENMTRFVNKIISPFLAFYIIGKTVFLEKKDYFPKEIYIYGVFMMWSLTGLPFIMSKGAFWNYFKIIYQTLFLFILMFELIKATQTPKYAIWGIFVSSILILGNAFYTGDLQNSFLIQYYRTAGVAKNPNEFAYAMLMGIWGILMLWGYYKNFFTKLVFIFLIILMNIGIIASASRKTFVSAIFFVIGWFFYCNREYIQRRRSMIIYSFLIAAAIVGTFYVGFNKTSLGYRVEFLFKSGEADPTGHRIELYKEGFSILYKNPIFGVGLGNFVFHSFYRKYTHSDFMEVATNTGLIGLFIYLFFYWILWNRLQKTKRILMSLSRSEYQIPETDRILYEVKFLQVALLTHLLIGFGRPHFIDIFSNTFVGFLIGYSYLLYKKTIELLENGRILSLQKTS